MNIYTELQGWNKVSFEDSTLEYKGIFILDGDFIEPILLLKKIEENGIKIFEKISGFFSFIFQSKDFSIIAVDIIRSIPIFFEKKDKSLVITSDNKKDNDIDSISLMEIESLGYITGSNTLYLNQYQLEAGKAIFIDNKKKTVDTLKYYDFRHENIKDFNKLELKKKLSEVFERTIKRLIKYANGRTIVLPLSGGYDSRIIATYIKKLNYNNVVCFTYGVNNNHEAFISKQVAKTLSFDWYFIEYNKELLEDEWQKYGKDYCQYSFKGVGLPHIQDWYAIKKLINDGVVDENSILVPGHAGDFVAGNHIPQFNRNNYAVSEIVNFIFYKNYSLKNTYLYKDILKNKIHQNINEKLINNQKYVNCEDFADIYENWIWKERQAKYITNSIRVYDYYNLEWWLPFWDREFVDYWKLIPYELRVERKFYIDWVDEEFYKLSEYHFIDNSVDRSEIMKKIIMYGLCPSRYIRLVNFINKKIKWDYSDHFLCFDGYIRNYNKLKLNYKGYNILGIYVDLLLNDKWFSTKDLEDI